ncbi:MAG: SOS response-associated peptidase, partial [Acidobacteriota bacterium]
ELVADAEHPFESHGIELTPRYNVAPTQAVATVRQADDGSRHLGLLRWGLIPGWAKDPSIGNRMINARSETAAEKPSFRTAMKRRRCLVLADGFYEWRKVSDGKQPYHIHLRGRRPFAFAGLWERWAKGPEGPLDSCTILTTRPADSIAHLHDRMPVILRRDDVDLWLDGSIRDPEVLEHLLAPYDGEAMAFGAVSRRVNSPRNDDADCLQAVEI